MTKKVLISLDELKDVICNALIDEYYEGWTEYEQIVNEAQLSRWFDAQPDVLGYTEVSAEKEGYPIWCDVCKASFTGGKMYRSNLYKDYLCYDHYTQTISKMETTEK